MAVALAAIACASKSAPPAAEAPPPEPAGATAAPPAEASTAAATSEESPPAASADAPEDELPKNCNYRVKGFCFADQEQACAASDCPPGKCLVLESQPARIKCAD